MGWAQTNLNCDQVSWKRFFILICILRCAFAAFCTSRTRFWRCKFAFWRFWWIRYRWGHIWRYSGHENSPKSSKRKFAAPKRVRDVQNAANEHRNMQNRFQDTWSQFRLVWVQPGNYGKSWNASFRFAHSTGTFSCRGWQSIPWSKQRK